MISEICQNLYVKRDQDPSFSALTMAWPKYCKIQICYVGTHPEHSFLYIYEIHLNYATCISRLNTRKNTYGTYFSCPSLEISSTSLSRRLSIAMSTSNRVAILKGRNELLMRTLFIEDLTQ